MHIKVADVTLRKQVRRGLHIHYVIDYMQMSTQRITITLPDRMAEKLRKESRKRRRPVSRLVVEALQEQERTRIDALMAEGYREASALNKELAEEALPAIREVLPPD